MPIAANIEAIENCIARACLRSGRKREELTLMGVTKFVPAEAVDEAWKAGLRCFGESRVQEAAAKFENAREQKAGMELHLIGALQRNKAKLAASLFDCIQSVDRESLVAELAKHTKERNSPLPLLLEFRTGEDSKSGFTDLGELFRTVELILAAPSLSVMGLMTIAPNTGEDKVLRSAFRQLAKVQKELERRYPAEGRWDCLSMGMSGDFETAIEEGSTLLRIGSAIFGERN
ncbi:MAG: YggS family pyridoxal phosphate-dependent enzyme [Treponema sp.]|jgi:pyridoxal phosphate enzyme (YggS family)|nr:YggS family pyridoxal phosphate-dependent enzyme [Treponema sp.]